MRDDTKTDLLTRPATKFWKTINARNLAFDRRRSELDINLRRHAYKPLGYGFVGGDQSKDGGYAGVKVY